MKSINGKIVVVGGGISGLTVAHELVAQGADVALFEAAPQVGGRIGSEHIGGFLFEHGPNCLVAPAPAAQALIDDVGLAHQTVLRGEAVRHRYLVRDGAVRSLPMEPYRLLLSDFFSWRARLRLMAEPFVPPYAGDETIAAFMRRRFGAEFHDTVMDALVGGLYAGDPEQLSVSAVFPHLKRIESEAGSITGGLIRNRLRHGKSGAGNPATRMLFSFRNGIAQLPVALASGLGQRIHAGHRVESLQLRAGGGFRLRVEHRGQSRSLDAAAVVLCVPAPTAARLLAPWQREGSEALAALAHPPLAVVFLGYRALDVAHPLDGLGVLAPAREKRGVLGMMFSSTLFAGRAPAGHVALTAFVGGARAPELALQKASMLREQVHEEARQLLGVARAPVLARVRYWRHGLPQPGLDHAARLEYLGEIESGHPGLFFAGNYRGGVSVANCIAAAAQLAERIGDSIREISPVSARAPSPAAGTASAASPAMR
ncbi:MAG: protoporphyrinogen oxidase [Pseudomonadota bacterium]|nr:protoporphyrinogen oxidase [Pseudomonadota bacterium]